MKALFSKKKPELTTPADYVHEGNIRLQRGDAQGAVDLLTRAGTLFPENSNIEQWLAKAQKQAGIVLAPVKTVASYEEFIAQNNRSEIGINPTESTPKFSTQGLLDVNKSLSQKGVEERKGEYPDMLDRVMTVLHDSPFKNFDKDSKDPMKERIFVLAN